MKQCPVSYFYLLPKSIATSHNEDVDVNPLHPNSTMFYLCIVNFAGLIFIIRSQVHYDLRLLSHVGSVLVHHWPSDFAL